jgi:DNA-binding CsgD family transcriptional regulator
VAELDAAGELHKIASLMALRAIADKTKGEAVNLLAACGFSTKDIADLLSISGGSVRGHMSLGRKKAEKNGG